MEREVIETRNHEGGDGEGHTGDADFASVPSSSEGGTEEASAQNVVETVVGIGEAGIGVGLIRLETYSMS